jgi:hypothetical protein
LSRSSEHPKSPRRRLTLAAAATAAAALALTGCQTKMGTAAFVGDHRITDHDLRAAVDDGLADPRIRKLVDEDLKGDFATYQRVVLDNEVQHLLVTEAARRLHVSVTSADVQAELDALTRQAGGADSLSSLFARNGLTEEMGQRAVRDQALLAEIGYASGAHRATDAELRKAYDNARTQLTTFTLGVVQVDDEATANAVLDRLRADPKSFSAVAAQHAGGATTPSPQQVRASDTNPALLSKLENVEAGDGVVFTQAGQNGGAGLVAVVMVLARDVAPFEQVRPQLESNTVSEAETAAGKYLTSLARELGVRVNPRYGTWDYTKNQIADLPDPLVKLRPTSPAQAAGSTVPGTGQDSAPSN